MAMDKFRGSETVKCSIGLCALHLNILYLKKKYFNISLREMLNEVTFEKKIFEREGLARKWACLILFVELLYIDLVICSSFR